MYKRKGDNGWASEEQATQKHGPNTSAKPRAAQTAPQKYLRLETVFLSRGLILVMVGGGGVGGGSDPGIPS